MPDDLFSRGMAWLVNKQRRHCSRPVVYERVDPDGGPPRLIPVPAVLGQHGASAEASVQPIRIDSDDIDFLIAAADLVLDGQPVEPRVDDRIRMEANGRVRVYEVLPRGNDPRYRGGNTPWRWSDPQQTIRRIRGKLVDECPMPAKRPRKTPRVHRAGHSKERGGEDAGQ